MKFLNLLGVCFFFGSSVAAQPAQPESAPTPPCQEELWVQYTETSHLRWLTPLYPEETLLSEVSSDGEKLKITLQTHHLELMTGMEVIETQSITIPRGDYGMFCRR